VIGPTICNRRSAICNLQSAIDARGLFDLRVQIGDCRLAIFALPTPISHRRLPICNVQSNYAEARGGESRRDFIHKMQLRLKELRETRVWLRYVQRLSGSPISELAAECQELIAIFVQSINTAKASSPGHRR
jgi:hypothetical protein